MVATMIYIISYKCKSDTMVGKVSTFIAGYVRWKGTIFKISIYVMVLG